MQENSAWHEGDVGADVNAVHRIVVTAASWAGMDLLPQLLWESDEVVIGDTVYANRTTSGTPER